MLTPIGMEDRPNDRFDHSLSFSRHIAVPEAQDSKVLRFQKLGALVIVNGPLDMLAAVQFDDQPALETREIGNVWTNWNLASKPRARNLSSAKVLPENLFGFRRCLPKFAGKAASSRLRRRSHGGGFPRPYPPPSGEGLRTSGQPPSTPGGA